MTDFSISGLSPEQFAHLYGMDDDGLRRHRARRYLVDCSPGFPDRVEMRDLEPGESALLVNYTHHDADTPYRSSHAVFVREGATASFSSRNSVPQVLRIRMLSVRAFDDEGMLLDAGLTDGMQLEDQIEQLFANARCAYLHVHYAKFGCYAARIDRA